MARPKHTFTEAARRAQLIACAIDVLADFGYLKASLAQIAKCATISTSVVSYYFAGKDDLMRAVLDEIYRKAALFMEGKIDLNAPARKMLLAYIESNLAYGRGHAKQVKALSEIIMHWRTETGKIPPELTSDDAVLKPLEELLLWGQQTGEFRMFNALPMAITIRKAIDGAIERFITHPETDMDAYTHELTALFDLATRT